MLIGPGERVDLIVDFAAPQNSKVELKSVARPDGPDKRGSKTYEGPLMQFRVRSRIPNDPPIPAELRPLPTGSRRRRKPPARPGGSPSARASGLPG